MHKVSLALAVAATSTIALAQNCNTSPPASTIRTYDPWGASFYYGNLTDNSLGTFIDLDLASPVEITQILMTTYDQGAGNPVVPNQVGNIAEVQIFLIPGSRVGNELSPANWGIDATGAGTMDGLPEVFGELTVVAWNGDSPIGNFNDGNGNPVNFLVPAGQYGMCIQTIPTTATSTPFVATGNSVGALHQIGISPNPAITWQDQFITLSNDGIQQNGWFNVDATGAIVANATPNGAQDSVNIAIGYTPDPGAAVSVAFGEGCYDRPQAAYDILPENTASGSAYEGNGYIWLPSGSPITNYIITPGAGFSPVTSGTNLAAGTFTSSSSASWDDACQTQPLGFTFPFAGGSTTDITINSNGKIYLGLTTDGSFATNGSNYGSTAVLRDGPPSGPLAQICAFNADLDLDQVLGGGALYFENPTPTTARITWQQVPNWPAVATELCDIQLTLYDSGQFDIAFGNLYNSAVGSGNSAILGFAKGDGSPLGSELDWSAAAGIVTGDGAFPPALFVDGRPIAGQSVDVVVDNLTPGTNAGFVTIAFGFTPAPGLNLGGFGLPGCFGHIDIGQVVTSVFLFQQNNELRWTWNVPSGFNGTQIFLQSGTITPGLNAAGIVATNGLCAKIGT